MSSLNEIPRGQLPMIVLSTLVSGDKYGLEIISGVEEKTNGALIIKQPSLYSALKRMEENSLITSYWQNSTIGGRRHYYAITDSGKEQLLKWQDSTENNNSFMKSAMNQVKNDNNIQKEPVLENTNDTTNEIQKAESILNSALIEKQKEIETLSAKVENSLINANETTNCDEKNVSIENKMPDIIVPNLTNTNQNLPIDEKKQIKPVYVQNNLFDNNSKIAEPIDFENCEIKKTKDKALAKSSTKIKKESFNIDKELEKIITRPKSFFETIHEHQTVIDNTENDLSIKKDGDEIEEKIETKNTFSENEINEQKFSSFVTERLAEDKFFRVKKIQPPIFDIRTPTKFVNEKTKIEISDPALLQVIQSDKEIDRLEMYLKAKNVQIKKYTKFASKNCTQIKKINFYKNNFLVSLFTIVLSLIMFSVLVFSLKKWFVISKIESIISFTIITLVLIYLALNFILMFIKRQLVVYIPRKLICKKIYFLSYILLCLACFSIFLLMFSFDIKIIDLIYKMLLTTSILLLYPFSFLSQKIVNKIYMNKM
ncbi:MAG: PadR family transcriptional regulator [Clostridia bacterium]